MKARFKSKAELSQEDKFFLSLGKLNLSPSNFFIRDGDDYGALKTVELLTEDNNGSLPFTLADIEHQAKLWLELGCTPREAFINMCADQPAWRLMQALAVSIAREAKARAKTAKKDV